MKGNVRGLMRSTDNGDRATRLLDAIDANIVVLDSEGFIVTTNKGWRKFAADNRLSERARHSGGWRAPMLRSLAPPDRPPAFRETSGQRFSSNRR